MGLWNQYQPFHWLPLTTSVVHTSLQLCSWHERSEVNKRQWLGPPEDRCSATVCFPWQLHVLGTVFYQPSGMRHHFCRSWAACRHAFSNWRWLHFIFLCFKITTNSVKCPCNVIHDSVTLISALLIESGVICNHWAVELVQEIGRQATLTTGEPRESTLLFRK